jgi:hypothetical protein
VIAGLLVVKSEMDARDSDSCAEFRRDTFRTELRRLVDAIECMERVLICETGVVRRSPPPGSCPTNAHLFVEKEVEAEVGGHAAQPRRRMQGLVTKGIDLLAIGSVAGLAQSKVRIYFLGTRGLHGGREPKKTKTAALSVDFKEPPQLFVGDQDGGIRLIVILPLPIRK